MTRLLVVSVGALHDPHRTAYDMVARRLGWEVHVAAPTELVLVPGRPPKQLVPKQAGAAYELHALPHRFYPHQRLHWYQGLSRLVARIRPTHVLVEYDPGSVPTLHAKLPPLGQKVIAFTVENILRDRWLDARQNLLHGQGKKTLRDGLVATLGSVGWRATDGLACISEEGRRLFESSGWNKPIEVVPLGTNVSLFCPGDATALRQRLDIEHNFVVGYFGRLVPEKGVLDVVEAVARCSSDVVLMLDAYENMAPGSFAAEVFARIDALGLRTRVRTVHAQHHEVPEYMRCCQVLALPSRTTERWKEQFGRVLPEAMACEAAVIGSTSGNIPDMIGDAGVLVPENDTAALAAAIEDLRTQPAKRTSLAKAGRQRVIQRFSTEAQADALGRLVARL
jgi:glycosyltransferase involved in cell wall biosynthesis